MDKQNKVEGKPNKAVKMAFRLITMLTVNVPI